MPTIFLYQTQTKYTGNLTSIILRTTNCNMTPSRDSTKGATKKIAHTSGKKRKIHIQYRFVCWSVMIFSHEKSATSYLKGQLVDINL